MSAAPVRYHHTLESPVLTQNLVKKNRVLGAPGAVYLVISSHHAECVTLNHGSLKRRQIYLTHGTRAYNHIHAATVGLLVVKGKMLYANSHAVILNTPGITH